MLYVIIIHIDRRYNYMRPRIYNLCMISAYIRNISYEQITKNSDSGSSRRAANERKYSLEAWMKKNHRSYAT